MRSFIFSLFCFSTILAATEHSGRRVPGMALPDSNVNYHDLYDYRGKIVLLDLIQTSCPVCNSSQRIFETIRQKWPDKVAVLSIVTPPDTQETVRRFIAQNNVKSPVLFDCGQAVAALLRLTPKNANIALPHLFIIDWKGVIRSDYEYKGGTEKYFDELEPLQNEVAALVKEMESAGGAGPAGAKGGAPAPKAPGAAKPKAPAVKK